jgi:hypothetical protein
MSRIGGEEMNARVATECLFGLILEEGDKIVAVLGLLETAEGHLGTGNVLLGVLEVLELRQVSVCSEYPMLNLSY